MRRIVVLIAALAAALAVAVPSAQAHRLSLVKAHSASVNSAEFSCNGLAECTDYHVDPCRRLSAHKVRCAGHMFLEDPASGLTAECTWDDQWSIKGKSRQLHWSPKVFDRTFQCL